MGYSIGIRPRSKKLRDKLLTFMRAHYRSWPVLSTGKEGDCYAGAPTDDPSYDHGKFILGLDYGVCSGWEREYAFTLVRWMALRIGTNRRAFSNGIHLEVPTPFMVYDGYETWPILVGTKTENRRRPAKLHWCCTDDLGIHNGPNALADLVQHEMFSHKNHTKAFKKAIAKVGPCPEKGDRFAWKNRLNNAYLPFVQPELDRHLGFIRDELKRLTSLWDKEA